MNSSKYVLSSSECIGQCFVKRNFFAKWIFIISRKKVCFTVEQLHKYQSFIIKTSVCRSIAALHVCVLHLTVCYSPRKVYSHGWNVELPVVLLSGDRGTGYEESYSNIHQPCKKLTRDFDCQLSVWKALIVSLSLSLALSLPLFLHMCS